VKPIKEICSDKLDNNCNGEVDESCASCSNGQQDADEDGVDCGPACGNTCGAGLSYLILTAAGLAILVGVAIAIKKGKLRI
jgi:hypothetical protein